MGDKFKYIPNDDTQVKIIPFVDYNWRLKRLDNKQTNQNTIKFLILKQTNKFYLQNMIIIRVSQFFIYLFRISFQFVKSLQHSI